MKRVLIAFLFLTLAGAGCTPRSEVVVPPAAPPVAIKPVVPSPSNNTLTFPGELPDISNRQIRLSTPKGDIVFELFADSAPQTVSNFLYLTDNNYYDGLTFHRRVEGFVIQGGDPKGNGTGGPGYRFPDELSDDALFEPLPQDHPAQMQSGDPLFWYRKGMVAMANSGPNTNGSQFFIMLEDYPLPRNYTIFGRVLSGMDVVDQIKVGDVMTKVMVEEKGK